MCTTTVMYRGSQADGSLEALFSLVVIMNHFFARAIILGRNMTALSANLI